jgi:hypothetical protein
MRTFCQRSVVRRERGVVLYVALVVMVIMMLAGVAVLRSVGAGQGVAGNLAFKQNATSAGDFGVTKAMGYLAPANAALVPAPAVLGVDLPAQGYFASWNDAFNPATFAWDTDPSVVVATADDGTGNEVRYVIHRLCSTAGSTLSPNVCVSVMDGATLGTGGGGASTTGIAPPPASPYYRVTTRIKGPRNTVSYTQVVMK